MCRSSGEVNEDNCSSKDCIINDRNHALSKCNSITYSNEERAVRDVEENCGVKYCRFRLKTEMQAMN
jgi:hypothetical protein